MTLAATAMDVLRIPSWAQYEWLLHGFSSRSGGISSAYGGHTLNLGWTKEDDAASVRENRQRFVDSITANQDRTARFALVGMRQVHSTTIHEVRDEDAPAGKLATPDGKPVLEGDGLITDVAGVLLATGTADCVPVLVADIRKRIVGAFHAGWRGTVSGIAEGGIFAFQRSYASKTEDMIAAIGPSIGPCCYSVGEEVRTAFSSRFDYADSLFCKVSTPERWRLDVKLNHAGEHLVTSIHLDLWEANRRQLLQAGLADSQITVLKACTACSRDAQGRIRFFSHRAEQGTTGRMLSVIGITDGSQHRGSQAQPR